MDHEVKQENRRVAIVTGAAGAIGQAIAQGIAARPGYVVVLLGRDESRTRAAAQAVQKATNSDFVRYEIVDLSRKAEIDAFAAAWKGPLHVLVNNAGITPRARRETPEGIEMQFAVNVLGYFWMIRAFEQTLMQSAPARVINVSSYYAGDLDLADLEFKRRRYDNRTAYRQSKQANRMLTAAFAAQFGPHDVTVNACHPGDVNSRLANDLGFGGHETPEEGADTPVWLAVSPGGGQENGQFFENRRIVHDPFVQDRQAVEELYRICQAY